MDHLTLFFDSFCPLCVSEMRHLKTLDKHNKLRFVDIQDEACRLLHPDISYQRANSVLHAKRANGEMLLGLDATVAAWQAVGKGRNVNWLRWRWMKPIADALYLVFAKHRYKISFLLTGKKRCKDGQCRL